MCQKYGEFVLFFLKITMCVFPLNCFRAVTLNPLGQSLHRYQDLVQIFDACFGASHNTQLVKGGCEPLYLPSHTKLDGYVTRPYHQIIFAHGFFRSALHEIAHWLVAGAQRRQRVDYGYWYEEDGRSAAQQVQFEQVEVRPQAIEWILTRSCGHKFCVSIDNLNGEMTNPEPFKRAVAAQAQQIIDEGLSVRMSVLQRSLASHYGQSNALDKEQYAFENL